MTRVRELLGPVAFLAAAALAAVSTSPSQARDLACLSALGVLAIFLARNSVGQRRVLIVAISCVAGGTFALFVAIAMYPAAAGAPFDPVFVARNLADAVPTAERTLGPVRVAFTAAILLVAAVAGARLAAAARLSISRAAARRLLAATIVIAGATVPAVVNRLAGREYPSGLRSAQFPATRGWTTDSDESVFILQPESVNALAEAGYVVPGLPAPGLEAGLFRSGVFFPEVIAGNMMTDRAQATILCGATRELGTGLSRNLEAIAQPCVPELLRRSGYRTIFYSDFRNRGFANAREFVARTGFDEAHFGDLARPGDPARRWGYEDRVYYRRIFADLAARHPDNRRLFVYIAVSSDHFPFDEVPESAGDPPAFRGDAFAARYLRTLADQDASLVSFRTEFDRYTGRRAHLFVAPDHSFPVGLNGSRNCARGATPDNFLTTLAYVPPESRAAEFCVGSAVGEFYGQEAIAPTIFEVLNSSPYPKSLGPALWRRPLAAEALDRGGPCATFAQPFDGGYLVAVRDGLARQFSLARGSVREFDLKRDIVGRFPRTLHDRISAADFFARYDCAD